MKLLVIGGGGREHALAWKLSRSPLVSRLYCAPGNAGIAEVATCVNIAADCLEELLAFARQEAVDLTVVGPELPLTLGVVDRFTEAGLRIVGPTREAARLEGSKAFAKELMSEAGIPTAAFRTFDEAPAARSYIKDVGAPLVVKADGLAAGKGVRVCAKVEEALAAVTEIMEKKIFGEAGSRLVVEECLTGEEASFIVLCDGERVLPLEASQDHKPVYDGDEGPNTGGMGAYSPTPAVDAGMREEIMTRVMRPLVETMSRRGCPFRGVLYAGLMLTARGPKVLEFNVRFGDPETQPLVVRLESDLVPALVAAADGELSGIELEWDSRTAVCVVMASGGYPGSNRKGLPITGLEVVQRMPEVEVFHAGTARSDGGLVTAGGRVLGVTALGEGAGQAIDRAYQAVEAIHWEGVHYRRDIGRRALQPR